MTRKTALITAALAAILAATLFFGYQRWSTRASSLRDDALSFIPPDATAAIFADFATLRKSPFLAQLYSWAPHPQTDPEYAKFVRETGFDYERDLDRVIIITKNGSAHSSLFAIAEGKFDRAKIEAYAARTGTTETQDGRTVHSVQLSGAAERLSFLFLSSNRIALTDEPDLAADLARAKKNGIASDWRERFGRLSGSPIFAVIRQEPGAANSLAQQAPGGFRSPQLSALLDQLQWITLAAKPDGDHLRVVTEGECASEATTRQLSDLLNGVIVLAQTGLNDGKARQQLEPQTREAYLDLLKTVDVSRIDRNDTKSIRMVFDVTPQFLAAAKTPTPAVPAPTSTPQKKPVPGKLLGKK